jgi:hypothetical protein
MIQPALAVRLHVEKENMRLDVAADVARELLSGRAGHFSRPPAIELAWVAEQLDIGARVREWVDAIAYGSRWSDAALAILDGELEQAANLFAEIGSLPDEAYARLRLAEQLVAAGRHAEADEQLLQTLAFWRSVRATRYVREGEALLTDASEIPAQG